MLIVKNLTFAYPGADHFHLQCDALTLKSGTFHVLKGANGCGKSTFLHILAGLLKSQSGTIMVNNLDVTHAKPHRRMMAMLCQQGNVFTHLTVFENLALGVHPRLKLTGQDKIRIQTMMDQFDLLQFYDTLPSHLSVGQNQKIALVRAILQNKKILLMDEPTAALAPELKYEVMDFVYQLTQSHNMCVLMVTHDTHYIRHTVTAMTIDASSGCVREF